MVSVPFLWKDGKAVTPEEMERSRKAADVWRGQATDTSPVGHWSGAVARALAGFNSMYENEFANRADAAGTQYAQDALANRQSMQSPVASALAGGSMGAQAGVPTSGNAAAIRQGLIARGLPEHIADGFLMNFQDESGLDSGINEINPTVPGSRGGFGLYQLTGPRRTAYEAFAQQRGVPASDTDAQLDWLMHELQGPEAKAAQSIFSAQNAGEAGAAIVNNFLRPAPEHRTSRANKYLGAGAGSYAAPSAGNVSEIAALLADPWVARAAGPQLQAEMQQQMQMQNAAYQQQLDQQDPRNQIALQMAQLELERAQNPAPPKPIEINGQLVDPNTLQVLGDYRTINPEDSARYRPVGGQIWDFQPENGGAPVLVGGGQEEVVFGTDGQPIFSRGPSGSGKSLTEGQSKDVVYSTRAEGALRGLEQIDPSVLTSRQDAILDKAPMGLGRELQNPDYQVAQNLGNEFLQAILRKDTGAAITTDEQELYGKTYLPQPGDSPAVLQTKSTARARAIEAMKAGMDMRQTTMTEQALIRSVARTSKEEQGKQQAPSVSDDDLFKKYGIQ